MTTHEPLSKPFRYAKPFVYARCTCGWETQGCLKRDEAEKKLLRHVERANQREAELAAHIKKVVDAAPPLSDEQRATLAVLLRPSDYYR